VLLLPDPGGRVERLSHAAVLVLQDNGAHIFFCGLKGMMPGIQEMLERVSKVPCFPALLWGYGVVINGDKRWDDRQLHPCTVLLCARQVFTKLACFLQEKGMDWEGFFERLKKNGQWHVEVY
jgi:hypothetical protein